MVDQSEKTLCRSKSKSARRTWSNGCEVFAAEEGIDFICVGLRRGAGQMIHRLILLFVGGCWVIKLKSKMKRPAEDTVITPERLSKPIIK